VYRCTVKPHYADYVLAGRGGAAVGARASQTRARRGKDQAPQTPRVLDSAGPPFCWSTRGSMKWAPNNPEVWIRAEGRS